MLKYDINNDLRDLQFICFANKACFDAVRKAFCISEQIFIDCANGYGMKGLEKEVLETAKNTVALLLYKSVITNKNCFILDNLNKSYSDLAKEFNSIYIILINNRPVCQAINSAMCLNHVIMSRIKERHYKKKKLNDIMDVIHIILAGATIKSIQLNKDLVSVKSDILLNYFCEYAKINIKWN